MEHNHGGKKQWVAGHKFFLFISKLHTPSGS